MTKDISLSSDLKVGWSELLENLDNAARLARYAGPGGWNDLGEPAALCTYMFTCTDMQCGAGDQAAGESGQCGQAGALCGPWGLK